MKFTLLLLPLIIPLLLVLVVGTYNYLTIPEPRTLADYIKTLPPDYHSIIRINPASFYESGHASDGEPIYSLSLGGATTQVDFENGRSARLVFHSAHDDGYTTHTLIPYFLYYSIQDEVGDYAVAYLCDGTKVISREHWCSGLNINLLTNKKVNEKKFLDFFQNGYKARYMPDPPGL